MRIVEVVVPLTTGSSVARTGSGHAWLPTNIDTTSKDNDGSFQTLNTPTPFAGAAEFKMEYLQRVGFTTPASVLTKPMSYIKVRLNAQGGGPGAAEDPVTSTVVWPDAIYLVKGGAVLTAVGKGQTRGSCYVAEDIRDYTFTRADLDTLGILRADYINNPADFGCVVGMTNDDWDGTAGLWSQVDQLALVFGLLEDEEDMDYHKAGMAGGWEVAAAPKALPSVSSSAAIFSDVPDDVTLIEITVRTADLVIRWNIPGATTAATTTTGNTYAAGGTYKLHGNKDTFLAARAIESGGTSAGTITYWKPA